MTKKDIKIKILTKKLEEVTGKRVRLKESDDKLVFNNKSYNKFDSDILITDVIDYYLSIWLVLVAQSEEQVFKTITKHENNSFSLWASENISKITAAINRKKLGDNYKTTSKDIEKTIKKDNKPAILEFMNSTAVKFKVPGQGYIADVLTFTLKDVNVFLKADVLGFGEYLEERSDYEIDSFVGEKFAQKLYDTMPEEHYAN